MFYLVFFTKSALTDGAGWKSSSGVILGVRNGRMTWSIPLSSFSALVTGETSLLLPILHISGRIMHGKYRIGKILLVGWCNVTAICWKLYFMFMLSTLARTCGGCLGRHYYEIRSFAISLICHLFEFSHAFLERRVPYDKSPASIKLHGRFQANHCQIIRSSKSHQGEQSHRTCERHRKSGVSEPNNKGPEANGVRLDQLTLQQEAHMTL